MGDWHAGGGFVIDGPFLQGIAMMIGAVTTAASSLYVISRSPQIAAFFKSKVFLIGERDEAIARLTNASSHLAAVQKVADTYQSLASALEARSSRLDAILPIACRFIVAQHVYVAQLLAAVRSGSDPNSIDAPPLPDELAEFVHLPDGP